MMDTVRVLMMDTVRTLMITCLGFDVQNRQSRDYHNSLEPKMRSSMALSVASCAGRTDLCPTCSCGNLDVRWILRRSFCYE